MLTPSEFLAQHKHALLLIIGATQTLLDNIGERTLLITKASASFQPSALNQWLSEQLDLRFPEDETSQKECLNYFLTQIKARNKKFLLVIENAQHLSFSTLAALSHLAIAQEKSTIVMPIFLTGDKSLIKKAQLLQINKIPQITQEPLEKTKRTAANNSFWKRHAIKSIAVVGLAVLGFAMHHFNQHPLNYHQAQVAAEKPPRLFNNVIALGPDVILRESRRTEHKKQYTIQLAASKEYKTAAEYIEQHHLKNAQIHLKKVKNKSWFVVNYGNYRTKTAALKAEKKLPSNIQKHQPWVTHHIT